MAKNDIKSKVGAWAFLIGVLIALIIGVLPNKMPWMYAVLVVAGIIVGFFNVTDKESSTFLMAAVSLVIVSSLGSPSLANAWAVLKEILDALLVLFVPTTIVVAIKAVFGLAKN